MTEEEYYTLTDPDMSWTHDLNGQRRKVKAIAAHHNMLSDLQWRIVEAALPNFLYDYSADAMIEIIKARVEWTKKQHGIEHTTYPVAPLYIFHTDYPSDEKGCGCNKCLAKKDVSNYDDIVTEKDIEALNRIVPDDEFASYEIISW